MQRSQVIWELSDYCSFNCIYCPPKFRGGEITNSTDSYINAIKQIQETRYDHIDVIDWKIQGGDPLVFPNINQLLKQIKTRNSFIELNTSGGDNWFDIMGIADYIDYLKLTTHYWQNPSVFNFILDYFQEKQKKLTVTVPLFPGKILESKEAVRELLSKGVDAKQQILRDNNLNNYWQGYAQSDINLIEGRRADEDPVKYEVKHEVKQTAAIIPDSTYVDLSKAPTDQSPSYTGKLCYAGIDYLEINSKGFVSGSKCRGRTMGNIFEEAWRLADSPFACPMLFCRESDDRTNIRMNQ